MELVVDGKYLILYNVISEKLNEIKNSINNLNSKLDTNKERIVN